MRTVTIYRGDTPTLQFTIGRANGAALDLTDSTVHFAARLPDSTTPEIDAAADLADETHGVASVTLTALQTAVAGSYLAEVEVRWAADEGEGTPERVYTATQFTLQILDDVRK